jgi:hypothetical protein
MQLEITGLANTANPFRDAWAPAPPELNTTVIETFAPAGEGPTTTINLLDDSMEQALADALLMMALQVPPIAGVMKLKPSTVIELD